MHNKIKQIAVASYVNVDGESFVVLYGISEDGVLWQYDRAGSKWEFEADGPNDLT